MLKLKRLFELSLPRLSRLRAVEILFELGVAMERSGTSVTDAIGKIIDAHPDPTAILGPILEWRTTTQAERLMNLAQSVPEAEPVLRSVDALRSGPIAVPTNACEEALLSIVWEGATSFADGLNPYEVLLPSESPYAELLALDDRLELIVGTGGVGRDEALCRVWEEAWDEDCGLDEVPIDLADQVWLRAGPNLPSLIRGLHRVPAAQRLELLLHGMPFNSGASMLDATLALAKASSPELEPLVGWFILGTGRCPEPERMMDAGWKIILPMFAWTSQPARADVFARYVRSAGGSLWATASLQCLARARSHSAPNFTGCNSLPAGVAPMDAIGVIGILSADTEFERILAELDDHSHDLAPFARLGDVRLLTEERQRRLGETIGRIMLARGKEFRGTFAEYSMGSIWEGYVAGSVGPEWDPAVESCIVAMDSEAAAFALRSAIHLNCFAPMVHWDPTSYSSLVDNILAASALV